MRRQRRHQEDSNGASELCGDEERPRISILGSGPSDGHGEGAARPAAEKKHAVTQVLPPRGRGCGSELAYIKELRDKH